MLFDLIFLGLKWLWDGIILILGLVVGCRQSM
jgi:hypothetical protein